MPHPPRLALARPTAGRSLVPSDPGGLPVRLRGESDQAFERFRRWLCPGEGQRRNISRTAREVGVCESALREQAARFEWMTRAIDYDRRRLAQETATITELQVSAAVSHVSLAQDLVDQTQRVIRSCEEMLATPDALDLDQLEQWQRLASGASKILEKAQKAARLALGQSDSNSSIHIKHEQVAPEADLSRLTDEQIRAYQAAQSTIEMLEAIAWGEAA